MVAVVSQESKKREFIDKELGRRGVYGDIARLAKLLYADNMTYREIMNRHRARYRDIGAVKDDIRTLCKHFQVQNESKLIEKLDAFYIAWMTQGDAYFSIPAKVSTGTAQSPEEAIGTIAPAVPIAEKEEVEASEETVSDAMQILENRRTLPEEFSDAMQALEARKTFPEEFVEWLCEKYSIKAEASRKYLKATYVEGLYGMQIWQRGIIKREYIVQCEVRTFKMFKVEARYQMDGIVRSAFLEWSAREALGINKETAPTTHKSTAGKRVDVSITASSRPQTTVSRECMDALIVEYKITTPSAQKFLQYRFVDGLSDVQMVEGGMIGRAYIKSVRKMLYEIFSVSKVFSLRKAGEFDSAVKEALKKILGREEASGKGSVAMKEAECESFAEPEIRTVPRNIDVAPQKFPEAFILQVASAFNATLERSIRFLRARFVLGKTYKEIEAEKLLGGVTMRTVRAEIHRIFSVPSAGELENKMVREYKKWKEGCLVEKNDLPASQSASAISISEKEDRERVAGAVTERREPSVLSEEQDIFGDPNKPGEYPGVCFEKPTQPSAPVVQERERTTMGVSIDKKDKDDEMCASLQPIIVPDCEPDPETDFEAWMRWLFGAARDRKIRPREALRLLGEKIPAGIEDLAFSTSASIASIIEGFAKVVTRESSR